MTDHEQILLTLDYYFEEKIFDGTYDSAKEVLAEAGLPYERLPQIMRALREMDDSGELAERYGSGRLTPNRALTRVTLERLAWQATPEDERSATGRSILQRRGEERGVTRVPLSSMTDHQLRTYIGPGALEEAGDMKKNGIVRRGPLTSGPASDAQERFAQSIMDHTSEIVRGRQLDFTGGAGSPTLFINYYNVDHLVRGAERENNRAAFSVGGFGPDFDFDTGKLRVELTVRFAPDPFKRDPKYSLRTKTCSPKEARRYIVQYLELCAESEPKLMSRNAGRESILIVPSNVVSDSDLEKHGLSTRRYMRTGPSGTGQRIRPTAIDMIKVETHPEWARSTGEKYARLNWCDTCSQYTEWGGGACLNCSGGAGDGWSEPGEGYSENKAEADETAARELSLFIENDYALVGAPNSQGKSIEANLLRKIKNGSFDLELSEQAWMYLMETGAKKYAKEFGDGERAWSKMFNKPTRELVAHEFATTFAAEHASGHLSRNASGASGPFTIEDLNTLTGTRQHRKATQYESLAEAEEVARGKASRSRSFAQFNVIDARGNVAFSISGHH